MSTRALITVKDQSGEYHIYRHSDGYPDSTCGVIADIERVINSRLVWPLPRFEADEFAAGIPALLKESGGGYRLSGGPESHGDIEFWYVVTCPGASLFAAGDKKVPVIVNWQGHGKRGSQELYRATKTAKVHQ